MKCKFPSGHAYPFGPPGSSCIDGYPHHINDKLVGPSPFIVWADRTTYSPGDNITGECNENRMNLMYR